MYEPGETIRIKSLEDITLTLDEDEYCDFLFFAPIMGIFCDQFTKLKRRVSSEQASSDRVWELNNNSWLWHENWFTQTDFLSDKDFEI